MYRQGQNGTAEEVLNISSPSFFRANIARRLLESCTA